MVAVWQSNSLHYDPVITRVLTERPVVQLALWALGVRPSHTRPLFVAALGSHRPGVQMERGSFTPIAPRTTSGGGLRYAKLLSA